MNITLTIYFFLADLVPLLEVLGKDHVGVVLAEVHPHEIVEIVRGGPEDGLEFRLIQQVRAFVVEVVQSRLVVGAP